MPIDLKDSRNREYVSSLFCEYLQREHRSDLIRLTTQPAHVHLSLVVHFNYLCEFDNLFSELLLIRPLDTLLLLDEGLRAALKLNCIESEKPTTHNSFLNVHTRLTALPVIPEVHRETIPWSSDVGKFIALRGTVSRVGPVQVLQGRMMFTCSKCGFQFYVDANFESHFSIKPPRFCPNRDLPCSSPYLRPSPDRVFYAKNYQEVWIHERFRCLTVGVMPRSISASFEDDLLETVKPGDDVVINGIVTRRWQPPRDGVPCGILLWIKVNYVENLSELKTGVNASHVPSERVAEFESLWSKHNTFMDALESRNILLRSLCPEVCGMYLVKLSLALLLAGAPEWSCSTRKFI
ncbi:hypothetical protein P879_11918 [Paragonimus westermani]|uniref:DNA helicase n=1 Tax=Paragonimus westermani TaxID=34504 RepID=A0A8T0D3W2_9TREM|nr:hypothetical protein P879_11918 [Paragonimus westermani]